jgi:hypothetical protein
MIATIPEEFSLPSIVPIEYATIVIPIDFSFTQNLADFIQVTREAQELIKLIPDDDLVGASLDDKEGWRITTDNTKAILYAIEKDFLSQPYTCIDAIIANFCNEVCDSCLDDLIETALNREFEVKILSGEPYIYFTTEEE